MNTGYGFSFRDKLIKTLGFAMLMTITVVGIMLVAGWKIKFISPQYCTGQHEITTGDAKTYWEVASREFPNSDTRYVTDQLVRMNGGTTFYGGAIKAPKSCRK